MRVLPLPPAPSLLFLRASPFLRGLYSDPPATRAAAVGRGNCAEGRGCRAVPVGDEREVGQLRVHPRLKSTIPSLAWKASILFSPAFLVLFGLISEMR